MFSSEVPNFQTRSLNFVCDVRGGCHGERLVDCSGSDQLPSSLQLPCVRILKPSWHHKSVSHAEVRGALGCCWTVCQSSLLERLLHGITNYLLNWLRNLGLSVLHGSVSLPPRFIDGVSSPSSGDIHYDMVPYLLTSRCNL
uniref:Uncharacterized protein n=1 Tax=Oncorhynchus tshawytscha TaxID=74940 RepID=A0A8C8JMY4_ONCTS